MLRSVKYILAIIPLMLSKYYNNITYLYQNSLNYIAIVLLDKYTFLLIQIHSISFLTQTIQFLIMCQYQNIIIFLLRKLNSYVYSAGLARL